MWSVASRRSTRNRQELQIEFYDCYECSTKWAGGGENPLASTGKRAARAVVPGAAERPGARIGRQGTLKSGSTMHALLLAALGGLEQAPARLLPLRCTDLVKPRQVAREVKSERRAREGSCSEPRYDLDEVRRVYARGRGDGAQHSPRGRRDRTVPGAADAGPAGVPGGEDRGGPGRGGI
jgi:hypothetical protein